MTSAPGRSSSQQRVEVLLESVGLDPHSFQRFLEWVLDEELVAVLATDDAIATEGFFSTKDALHRFRDRLFERTRRRWPHADVELLFKRVKGALSKHYRMPISAEEYLKLLWQVPLKCEQCGRQPPEVTLHVDHIFPASKGGPSKRANLRFLCADDNLRKSNNLEVAAPWLSLQ